VRHVIGVVASAAWRVALVFAVFGGVVWLSDRHGLPSPLPGAALGWPLLFHILRASAVLGGIGLVTLVGWRALHGEFPVKFGQLEYPAKAVDEHTRAATAAQEKRLQILEGVVLGVRPPQD
jgi:hypothetical protein